MGNQQPNTEIDRKPKMNHGFIYCYTSPSGKKYIGQTIQSLQERARQGKGYRKCGVFYRAILKYGFDAMKVEILEECDISLLDEKEREWIDFYDTRVPNGYNIAEGGITGNTRKVYQYLAKTGEFIQEYSSLTEAAKANGIDRIDGISNCLHGRRKVHFGYIWSFERVDKKDPEEYISNEKIPIYAYTLDGKFFNEYESINAGAAATDTNRGDIGKVLRGKIKFANGLIWSKEKVDSVPPIRTGKNGATPVKQIDKNTGEVIQIFSSQSEAARTLGLKSSCGISDCCVGRHKTCAGFRWEFCEGSTTTSPRNPVE